MNKSDRPTHTEHDRDWSKDRAYDDAVFAQAPVALPSQESRQKWDTTKSKANASASADSQQG